MLTLSGGPLAGVMVQVPAVLPIGSGRYLTLLLTARGGAFVQRRTAWVRLEFDA